MLIWFKFKNSFLLYLSLMWLSCLGRFFAKRKKCLNMLLSVLQRKHPSDMVKTTNNILLVMVHKDKRPPKQNPLLLFNCVESMNSYLSQFFFFGYNFIYNGRFEGFRRRDVKEFQIRFTLYKENWIMNGWNTRQSITHLLYTTDNGNGRIMTVKRSNIVEIFQLAIITNIFKTVIAQKCEKIIQLI